jgi:Flp pilus assembly pilin Flp
MDATRFDKPLKSEIGQGLTEYAILLVLVAAVVIGALTTFGSTVGSMYTTIANALPF